MIKQKLDFIDFFNISHNNEMISELANLFSCIFSNHKSIHFLMADQSESRILITGLILQTDTTREAEYV